MNLLPPKDPSSHKTVDWFFDRYSVVHVAFGAIFSLSKVPAPFAIGSHVAFESVENSIKPWFKRVWPDVRPDGWQNHAGDVTSFIAGYYGARALSESEGGRIALVALVATAGAIWTRGLMENS